MFSGVEEVLGSSSSGRDVIRGTCVAGSKHLSGPILFRYSIVVYQILWHTLSSLWKNAYERSLAINWGGRSRVSNNSTSQNRHVIAGN